MLVYRGCKVESIETILELADYKNAEKGRCEALVVAGCMAYAVELEKDLPEADLIIGTGEYNKITSFLKALLKESWRKSLMLKFLVSFTLSMIHV